MIRIKKLFSVLLAIMLCMLTLSGCHGSRDRSAFSLPDSFDMSRNYEIVFWAKNDTNVNQTRIYEKAIADFQAIYPNITVTLRLYTDYGRIYSDVLTNIATNTTPNVCITYPDHIATYLTGNNCVVPLDGLFTHEEYGLGGRQVLFDAPAVDEIVPKFLAECAFDGYHYAIPYMRSTEACYINKTYVEALGYTLPETLTWDFVWEVSEAAMAKDTDGNFLINGQKVMIPFIYKSTDNMMIQALRQLGAGYSTESGQVLLFNDTTREFLYTISKHVKTGAFSTFKISSYPANFLNAGQCIFAVDSTAGATWMGSDAPLIDIAEDQLVQFETAVMAIPQFDPENPSMISQGPSLCVFNKEDPQEVLASWLFAQYLLTNDVQIAYSCTEGYVPVTTKAQQSEEYQDYLSRAGEDNEHHYDVKIQAARLLLDNTEYTFVTPVFNGSASLRNAAGQLIEETAKGTRRKKKINDEFFQALYADMTALYHLDQIETDSDAAPADYGPLPVASRLLLIPLVCAWILILAYTAYGWYKKKKMQKKSDRH